MLEQNKQSHAEILKPESINAINNAIDSKFNNPTVVREDPNRGIFVLDDAGKNGHKGRTEIDIDNTTSGKLVRIIERFDEVTPRSKPSILVYDYELEDKNMVLIISKSYVDQGSLAKARLDELKSGGTILSSPDKDQLLFAPSESHAQKVLASLQEMKIFIS